MTQCSFYEVKQRVEQAIPLELPWKSAPSPFAREVLGTPWTGRAVRPSLQVRVIRFVLVARVLSRTLCVPQLHSFVFFLYKSPTIPAMSH